MWHSEVSVSQSRYGDFNLGFLYVTDGLAPDISSILTFVRETTHIEDWVGAAGYGVFGGGQE